MTIEGIRLRFRNDIYLPLTYKFRSKRLLCKDFTIISNNCWAGTIYESYGMQKLTPTAGLFFMAKDYLEFLSHLKEYVQAELHFIDPFSCRAIGYVSRDNRFGTYPVATLGGRNLV